MRRAAAAVLLAALTLLSMAPGALPIGAAPLQPDDVGHHMVAHIALDDPDMGDEAVVAAVDPDGELVMYAYSDGDDLFLTDGYDGQGEIIERRMAVWDLFDDWHRYDLVFEGDTYRLEFEQVFTFEGATLTYATEAAPLEDPRTAMPWTQDDPAPRVDRLRLDAGNGALESTFTQPWEETAWSPVVTGGTLELRELLKGHQSVGGVDLLTDIADEGVAYMHADVTGFSGVYSAEMSVRNACIVGAPGISVLAGLADATAEPTVNWALVLTKPGLGEVGTQTCGLALVTPGQLPRPLPVSLTSDWHTVSIDLDEDAGTLAVRLDGDPVAAFDDAPLGTSAHVAAGDVNPTLSDVSTRIEVTYDDAAVYPTP